MPIYNKKTLSRLLNGELSWKELKPIIGGKKDPERFDMVLEILQEKVPWNETILIPLHEHLFVVSKDNKRIVKCECGYEFGDYKENWKKKCRIRVRDTEDDIGDLYPKYMGCDPEWEELREFYCPSCFTLLDTETVPPGYPVIFNFLPDIDTFYEKWLGKDAPDR
ncbi:MAG: acetone carboxylase subunit gamma [Promethearchaeota archaeon]|nr:MAG: acetone carboxylase subunit gamma [Candidatus Lokiarchaeota archaeon]